jgi:hypothetical protein
MLDAVKQFIHAMTILQNSPSALVTMAALSAMAVTAFAMYVVLVVAGG